MRFAAVLERFMLVVLISSAYSADLRGRDPGPRPARPQAVLAARRRLFLGRHHPHRIVPSSTTGRYGPDIRRPTAMSASMSELGGVLPIGAVGMRILE
jgi:hypothetical protein